MTSDKHMAVENIVVENVETPDQSYYAFTIVSGDKVISFDIKKGLSRLELAKAFDRMRSELLS